MALLLEISLHQGEIMITEKDNVNDNEHVIIIITVINFLPPLEKPMRKWILIWGQRLTLVRAQTGTKGEN